MRLIHVSAESWENTTREVNQENIFSQRFQDLPNLAGSFAHQNLMKFRKPDQDWKRLYPDVLSPTEAPVASMISMAPKLPQLDKFEAKIVPPEERNPLPEACHSDTVQPLEVFQPPTGVTGNRFTLESVLAPAGSTESPINLTENASLDLKPQFKLQGKATRQNDVSAADAALTEVIRTALSGASTTNLSNGRSHTQEVKRNSLPNGRSTPGSSWNSGSNKALISIGKTISHINLVDSPSPDREVDESHAQKTAEEVLKKLFDAGYTLHRSRSASPKIQNPGSVASNKSDNQVTCQVCKKFKGRPCELKYVSGAGTNKC